MQLKHYAVYRGDDFLFIDTIKNAAKRINMTEQYLRYRASSHYHERIAKQNEANGIVLVRLED